MLLTSGATLVTLRRYVVMGEGQWSSTTASFGLTTLLSSSSLLTAVVQFDVKGLEAGLVWRRSNLFSEVPAGRPPRPTSRRLSLLQLRPSLQSLINDNSD